MAFVFFGTFTSYFCHKTGGGGGGGGCCIVEHDLFTLALTIFHIVVYVSEQSDFRF